MGVNLTDVAYIYTLIFFKKIRSISLNVVIVTAPKNDKIKYRKRSEGIETQEVLNQLTSMGYRCIQIYHFSSPLPIDEKEDFLIKGEI